MPNFNEDVNVNGEVIITQPWADWMFLRQKRNVDGNGGFHIHNPWGNSTQPQGAADRNRFEIAYRTSGGQDLWGQFVIHGPSGRVGIGTVILPAMNEADLSELPEEVRREMTFVPAETLEQVVQVAFRNES